MTNSGWDDRSGHDTVDYSGRTGDIDVSFDALQNDGERAEHDNVHSNMEGVLAGSGSDVLVGGKEAVTFFGGPGNDWLYSGKKQDQLHGGSGDDRFTTTDGLQDFIFTGPGNDNVSEIDVGLDVVSHADRTQISGMRR